MSNIAVIALSRVFLILSIFLNGLLIFLVTLADNFFVERVTAVFWFYLSIGLYAFPFYGLRIHPREDHSTRANWVWAMFLGLLSVWISFAMYYANATDLVLLDGTETVSNGLSGTSIDRLSPKDFFYYSTVTLTTLGYGDIQPLGTFRTVSAIQAVIGFITVPVAIAEMITQFYHEYDTKA